MILRAATITKDRMSRYKPTRTHKYVYLLLSLYEPQTLKALSAAKVEGVYLGDDSREIRNKLVVVTGKPAKVVGEIEQVHQDFKTMKYVAIVRIKPGFQNVVDKFWEGKYDEMYPSLDHVPRQFGNIVNPIYHVLANSPLGKANHKEALVRLGYADPESFHDWDTFVPDQSDFKPNPAQEILYYEPQTADNNAPSSN